MPSNHPYRIRHRKWKREWWRWSANRVAFNWHPYGRCRKDYSAEPQTRVEFRLEPDGEGTALTVTESGFDSIPAERRDEALRMNTGGWEAQVKNVKAHAER